MTAADSGSPRVTSRLTKAQQRLSSQTPRELHLVSLVRNPCDDDVYYYIRWRLKLGILEVEARTASHLSRERAPVFFVLPTEMGVGTSGDRHLAGDRPLADAADAIADSFDSVFDDDGKVRLRSLCQSMQ